MDRTRRRGANRSRGRRGRLAARDRGGEDMETVSDESVEVHSDMDTDRVWCRRCGMVVDDPHTEHVPFAERIGKNVNAHALLPDDIAMRERDRRSGR